jgi:hypothetical protein
MLLNENQSGLTTTHFPIQLDPFSFSTDDVYGYGHPAVMGTWCTD